MKGPITDSSQLSMTIVYAVEKRFHEIQVWRFSADIEEAHQEN